MVNPTFRESYNSPYTRTGSITRLLYAGDAPLHEQESNRCILTLLGTPRLTLYSDHIADAVPDAQLIVHTLPPTIFITFFTSFEGSRVSHPIPVLLLLLEERNDALPYLLVLALNGFRRCGIFRWNCIWNKEIRIKWR